MKSTRMPRASKLLPIVLVIGAWFLTAGPASASTYTITPGGEPVTVITDVAGENAVLKFDGLADHRVAVKLSGVTFGSSGCCSARMSILKPDGTTLKAASYFGESGAFFDPKTLPVDGLYKIVVDPEGTAKGQAVVTLYDVPENPSIPIVADGPGQPVSLTTPGQNASLPFDGTAGQRVSVELTNVTVATAQVSIVDAEGNLVLNHTTITDDGGFLGPRTLPADGPYRIVFNPTGAQTGGATIALYDVAANVTGSLAAGTPRAVTIDDPGQNASLTFNGQAETRFSIVLSSVSIGSSSCCGAKVSVVKPDGATLVPASSVGTTGGFIDATTLPVNGTYKVVVNPAEAATGSITLTLSNVPPNDVGELAFGEPHLFTLGTPGQNSVHTFAGTAGKQISLDVTDVTLSLSKVSIVKPDGSKLIFPTSVDSSGAFFDTKTLPQSGTYKVLLDPQGAATGNASLTVYKVPSDAVGSLVVGGPSSTISLGTPGQDGRLSFSASAGEALTLDLSSVTIGSSGCCSAKVSVLKPDGSKLVFPIFFGTSGASIDMTTTVAGTYSIVIDPGSNATGNVTLALAPTPAP
jgi:uncharacterized protein YhfF